VVTEGETLFDLESSGLLFLSKSNEIMRPYDYFVEMPFVQLMLINLAIAKRQKRTLFPEAMLFFPTALREWNWTDFELMLPHLHSARCRSLSELIRHRFDGRFSLHQLLSGSRGRQAFLDIEVSLNNYDVFYEDHQYDSPWH